LGSSFLTKISSLIFLIFSSSLSGLLLSWAFPLKGFAGLAWVALIPFLVSLKTLKTRQAALSGFLTGLFFFLGLTWWWLQEFKNVSLWASGLGYVYLSLYWVLFAFLLNVICRRSRFPLLAAAPPLWVLIEYLRSNLFFLAFPWALLAQTQHQNIPLIQIASITGIYGVSFVIMLVNSALADVILLVFSPSPQPSPPRLSLFDGTCRRAQVESLKAQSLSKGSSQAARGEGEKARARIVMRWRGESWRKRVFNSRKAIFRLLILIIISSGIWVWGWATSFQEKAGKKISVAVVQGNIPQKIKWDRDYRELIISRHETLTRQAAQTEPDLIIWPETSTPGLILKNFFLYNRVASLARESRSNFIIGSSEYPKYNRDASKGRLISNSAIFILPNGRIKGQYLKIRLLPFGEYTPLQKYITWPEFILPANKFSSNFPGKEFALFPVGMGKVSTLICWEIMFPELSRQAVARGANLLVNLANEAWFGKTDFPYLMLSNAVFRAVENRVNLVRAANTGISCFIDPYGRVTGRVACDGEDRFVEGTLTQTIYLNRPGTFYSNFGDILVYLSVGFTVFMLIYSWLKRKSSNMRAT
jgi:apolipoprotein N-acyltransferase